MKTHIFRLLFLCFVFTPLAVLAATPETAPANPAVKCESDASRECIQLENPLQRVNPETGKREGVTKPVTIIALVIKAALGLVGALTLVMMVWGGFLWLTSAGNPEKIERGTKTMLWAAVGVVLVFSSYLILNTVLDYITGAGA